MSRVTSRDARATCVVSFQHCGRKQALVCCFAKQLYFGSLQINAKMVTVSLLTHFEVCMERNIQNAETLIYGMPKLRF